MKSRDYISDKEIITNLRKGDGGAMEMLYKLYWEKLYLSAYNVLKDKEACEDIVQELFIRIWNNREEINITSSISAYLLAATRYEVYRRIRTAKNFEPIVDEMIAAVVGFTHNNILEYKQLQEQITGLIDQLPPKCKNVYKLSRNEQLSHKEISAKLNISTKTVRNHLTSALHFLRISIH